VRYGPFAFPVETVRDIKFVEPVQLRTEILRGEVVAAKQ
jgi:hypothetical protein